SFSRDWSSDVCSSDLFGENMLRADVCNAVDELGQLLDHTGPMAESELNAARIFHADHCFFVTNGTSTSNKIVWHANVANDDVVEIGRASCRERGESAR